MAVKQEYVVLVNERDQEIGLMEKQEAHEKGVLHRAFSVFIFNSRGELLLQQRAFHKYHSGGLWTNTCCSHPRVNEKTIEAAHRRLNEEMGFDCTLREKFHFIYKAPFDNGLTEHELDFIYSGTYDGTPLINTEEAVSFRWMSMDALISDIKHNPASYTEWFRIILNEYLRHLD